MSYKQIRRRTHAELGQNEGATPEVSHTPEVTQIQTDRDLMTADDALALQDVVGNQATGQLMGATTPPAPPRTGYIQPKPIPPQPQRPGGSPHAPAYAHLRRKPTLQRASWDGSFDTNADFESQVNQQSGGGKPLPSDVRADLEPKFGADFSGVKIHADANAAQLSQDVGAQAFTHGSDIYFNQGKYNPESGSGKHLLAHELTHTIQQGGAKPQLSLKPNQIELKNPPVLQRYKAVDNPNYTLTPDATPTARDPFTRFEDTLTIQAPQMGKQTKGIGWTKQLDNLPPLNVANDDTLAINATAGEPKEFYATNAVIDNANRELAVVDSPITLHAAGNTITLPPPATQGLVMVQPQHEDKDVPGQDEFVALNNSICRDTAQEIMGGSITHALLRDNTGVKHAPIGTTDSTVISGPHSLAKKLTQGDVSRNEGVEAIKGETNAPKVGEAYGKGIRPSGAINDRAEEIGINQSAWAKVGQGYVTQSIFDQVGSKIDYAKTTEPDNPFVWGYHFSAIVAESMDGDDQIAMENYNRFTSELKNARAQLLTQLKLDFATELTGIDITGNDSIQIGKIIKLIEENIHASNKEATDAYNDMVTRYIGKMTSHWYFRIIGKGVGQSFHEQMAASPFFVNPMTMTVANRNIPTPIITFAGGSSTLNPKGKTDIASTSARILAAVQQGIAPTRIRLIGHASGWGGTGMGAEAKGLSRANAVKAEFVQNGVNTNLFTTEGKSVSRSHNTNRTVKLVVED